MDQPSLVRLAIGSENTSDRGPSFRNAEWQSEKAIDPIPLLSQYRPQHASRAEEFVAR
jgi:hypothetical protein